jgi:hypothetical protein
VGERGNQHRFRCDYTLIASISFVEVEDGPSKENQSYVDVQLGIFVSAILSF